MAFSGMFLQLSISLVTVSTMLKSLVDGGAVLELRMIKFDNSKSKDWNNNCCDLFCWSKCDHIFRFGLDLGTSANEVKGWHYWSRTSGKFKDTNVNHFGSDIKGVSNPLITTFRPAWPGSVKFKVYVEDGDSTSASDSVDGFVHLLQPTPARSQRLASWTEITIRGVRPSHKTSLTMSHRLYCEKNYYSANCSVHCVAGNSDSDGHYTCDPETGSPVCRAGWEDRSTMCKVFSDDCVDNECKNGATCVDGNRTYTCVCPIGFGGEHCEARTRSGVIQCGNIHCLNEGTCNNSKCICRPGSKGRFCEVNINDCVGDPCKNDATCEDLVNDFRCRCLPGYTGQRCAELVPYANTSNPSAVFLNVPDQSAGVDALDVWFYTSFVIIFLLLVIITALIVYICCRRRRQKHGDRNDPVFSNLSRSTSVSSSTVSTSTEGEVSVFQSTGNESLRRPPVPLPKKKQDEPLAEGNLYSQI